MLTSIHIENIALIKNIDISLGNGFNVLTGETGAGKSIIIDALSLLCGARSDRSIIRSGEESALMENIFTDLSDETLNALRTLEVHPDEDGLLLLQRRLGSDGRSVARINSRQVPVSKLREVSSVLVAIHGQQDTQILADEQEQLQLLDAFARNGDIYDEYRNEYKKYTALIEKKRSISRSEDEKSFRLDMISYKLDEIEKANLSSDEEARLNAERTMLSNSEKIILNANETFDNLYRSQNSASDRLSAALYSLRALSGIVPEADGLIERLTELKYELDDISEQMRPYTEPDGEDPVKRLDAVEERLEQINSLKRKYKSDIEGILNEYDKLREEKEGIEYAAELLEQTEKQIREQLTVLSEKAEALNASRKEAAAALINRVEEALSFLDMPSVKFDIEFIKKDFCNDGNVSLSFLISANVGEAPKPIAKIASGGELSRLMLALKSIPAGDNIPVMIFDEIDSGISGKTSDKIGIKLSEAAKSSQSQIICVTHSAQIAARADIHMLISKQEADGRTITRVKELKGEDRADEIARIIGGVDITDTVRKTAEEMLLKQNQSDK